MGKKIVQREFEEITRMYRKPKIYTLSTSTYVVDNLGLRAVQRLIKALEPGSILTVRCKIC